MTVAEWGQLSDHLVFSATVVLALALVAHAAEWGFARARGPARETVPAARRAAELVGAELVGAAARAGRAGGGATAVADLPPTEPTPDLAAAEDGSARHIALFGRVGFALTILATAALGCGVAARGIADGRVPWSNMYEFATAGSFAVGVIYVVLMSRLRMDFLGLPLVGFLVLVLGLAIAVFYQPVEGLIPALQSYWLDIHVSAAALSTGIYTVGACASATQLLKARAERRALAGAAGGLTLSRLPSAATIDKVAYRLHAFAFPLYTFAMVAGAIWAEHAWGRYWSWDPKETWMFISWVIYAAYLHARTTAGWRKRLPWISLVGYGTVLFNLVGVNLLLAGFHSYAGV